MARLIASRRARLVSPGAEAARSDANAIRASAHADAVVIRLAAERAGTTDAEARAIGALLAITRTADELRESASAEVATLALEVAERIVGEAVSVDPALLARLVGRALERAKEETSVALLLHPEDHRVLVSALGGELPGSIRVVEVPDQLRGGCLVRGERVTIDARVESAIDAIARAMGVDPPDR